MPASPQLGADGVLSVAIKCNGAPLGEAAQLISVEVRNAVGQIPSARLLLEDGNMPDGSWELADGSQLLPGSAIEIEAGYGDERETIFEGQVVRLGVDIEGQNRSRLIVDCRDKAVAMTLLRRNQVYLEQTDSALMQTLVGNAGLSHSISATTPQHKELLQYHCSDWDFLLARAELNGLLVIVQDGKVTAEAPDVSGAAVLKVSWGIDLHEFSAEMDARTQRQSVVAVGWDPATQAIQSGNSASPQSLNAQGNLSGSTLAAALGGDGSQRLQTSALVDKASLDAWGKAEQLKAGLARLRGRLSFQGSAKARVGKLIELAGVGARFSGTLFIGRVEHRLKDGNWITEVGFGLDPDWFCARPDIVAPPNGGRLPGVGGLQVGVVVKLDGDPMTQQRIQIKLPVLQAETETLWARLLQGYASNGFGLFFLPEVGDEVLVGFFDQDPSSPVVLGSLYSSSRAPYKPLEAENNFKTLLTRCKHKLEFDEKDKIVTLTTPGNNKLVLDDKDKSIVVQDQHGNKIKLSSAGILLDSPKDIELKAKGNVSIDAVGSISLTAKADVKASGLNIECSAQVGFTGKGSASAELSAAGQTTVKGAMVMIN
jgi:Rhs element Vgr protein